MNSTPPRRQPRQRPVENPRPSAFVEMIWNFALVAVPLGSGLGVNAIFGWWPGLGAFLIAAVLIGTAAHRADPRHRPR
jgi:hypothetical protein